MKTDLPIDNKTLQEGAVVLRAINNNFRQKIIKLLNEKKRLNVTSIYKKLKFEQAVASQHLRVLRDARLVNAEREGKEIYYSLNYGRFTAIDRLVKAMLK